MNGAWWVIVNKKKKDMSWVSKVERRSGKGEELRSIRSKYIGFNSLKLIKKYLKKEMDFIQVWWHTHVTPAYGILRTA